MCWKMAVSVSTGSLGETCCHVTGALIKNIHFIISIIININTSSHVTGGLIGNNSIIFLLFLLLIYYHYY